MTSGMPMRAGWHAHDGLDGMHSWLDGMSNCMLDDIPNWPDAGSSKVKSG